MSQHGAVLLPTPSSEFPHDNELISVGGLVTVELPTDAPKVLCATAAAPPAWQPWHEPVPACAFVLDVDAAEPPAFEGPMIYFVDFDAAEEPHGVQPERSIGAPPEPPVPEPESGPFAVFQSALSRSLLERGATRAAALVPAILALQPLPAEALPKEARLTLASRGYLEGNGRYGAAFQDLCRAWTAVLRGEDGDAAACGASTLDRFGAELLCALLAVPATRTEELRRELRRAGIAAFGVLNAA